MSEATTNEAAEFNRILNEWCALARAKLEARDFTAVKRFLLLIRGTAHIAGHFQLAHLIGLAEAVSHNAITETNARTLKKLIDCLWDALATSEFIITHGFENTGVEQRILIGRLEGNLKTLGEPTKTLNQSEIDVIVRSLAKGRDLARKAID